MVRSAVRVVVTAVCVVHALAPDPGQDPDVTAIDKRAVAGPVDVSALGLAGDTQCDTEHHGGPEQAVYAYADEDAERWAGELGRPLSPGSFGENLRTSGLDVTGAEIGEQWQVGDPASGPLLEVTGPRIPCQTFATHLGEPHWVKRFTDRGAPGAYLRVVRSGVVRAGDPVQVVHRPGLGVTVGGSFPRTAAADARVLLAAAAAGTLVLGPRARSRCVRAAAGSG